MLVDLIILNYRNYEDTIELLKSIFTEPILSSIGCVHIIDNNSKNNSLENILASLPISYSKELITDDPHIDSIIEHGTSFYKVVSYQSNQNLGYAGGNNIGLKGFLSGESDVAIVCNNDLFFPEEQLSIFINESFDRLLSNKNLGLIGNILYYYDQPKNIQASGGIINNVLCRTKHLNEGLEEVSDETFPDYPIGALLMFTRDVLEKVGLLAEDYFLYYEELDYIKRMDKAGFNFFINENAKILHKEGASVGSNSRNYNSASLVSDYFLNVNKIEYSKRHNKKYLSIVIFVVIINAFRRIFRGEYKKGLNIFSYFIGRKVY